jgi:hypothetical protein
MDVVPGSVAANTIDTEINKTRDYIATRVTPVTHGGTGSTTASAARTALGLASGATAVASLGLTATLIPSGSGNVQADLTYLGNQVAILSARVAELEAYNPP